MITEMWMKAITVTENLKFYQLYGILVKTMLESDVKLGVSSRGSGNVSESGNGEVSDFEIITVDIVAQPSAPGAYPTPIYEQLMNARGGMKAYQLAQATKEDPKAQKYLKESLINIISRLQ
jgi:Prohead core protein protease.